MKFASLLLCAAALWAQTPASQNVQKVFFAHTSSPQAITDAATVLRTVADVPSVTVDSFAHSLTVSGPADNVALADWLFHELDQAAVPIQATVTHEYPLPIQAPYGPEVTKVFFLAHADTQQFVTDMVTGIRTLADVTRLFPYNTLRAIVARSTADRMDAGEWLIHEFDQPVGSVQAPAVHTYGVPMAGPGPNDHKNVMKTFFLAHAETAQAITDMVTAIRTVADGTRLFPFNSSNAIMVSASPDRVAAAEWLFHDLDQPAAETLTTSTYGVPFNLWGADNSALIVFHLSPAVTQSSLFELATSIHTTASVFRVFPLVLPRAIAIHGTPAAVAKAEVLVRQKDPSAAQ